MPYFADIAPYSIRLSIVTIGNDTRANPATQSAMTSDTIGNDPRQRYAIPPANRDRINITLTSDSDSER